MNIPSLNEAVRIEKVTGQGIFPYIDDLIRLRTEVFKEWPYLYKADQEFERTYIRNFAECEAAVVALVFEKDRVIGAMTGIPLESTHFTEPFVAHQLNPKRYFYFSEAMVEKPYRRLGLLNKMTDLLENHIENLKEPFFRCFCMIEREDDLRKPPEAFSLFSFAEKHGFTRYPHLFCLLKWKEVDIEKDSEHKLVFWIK